MPNKTLSVRPDDLPLWERAERAAKEARTTVSALVATALAHYLGETGTVCVQIYDDRASALRYEQFEGRWLVNPKLESNEDSGYYASLKTSDEPRYGHRGVPEEWRVGVAETGRGRVAVYLHHWNYDYDMPPKLLVFDSVDEAERALHDDPRVPEDLFEGLRISPPGPPVVWRDI
jgi:hypothetical protein